jgi:integrase
MKLDPTINVWEVPTESLSGRDRAVVYAQRANLLLAEALANDAAYKQLFRNGSVRRGLLATQIGCHRSTLTENSEIVSLLQKVEGRDILSTAEVVSPPEPEQDDATPPAVVQSMLKRLQGDCRITGRAYEDRIISSDLSCKIDKARRNIPAIVWSDGIDEVASDYLRHLVIVDSIESSTAKQYAKVLRAFLRLCRDRRRDWSEVDDSFLRSWRDTRRTQVDDLQVVSELNTVFQFFVWAERTGWLSYHVGIYNRGELPDGFKLTDFAISAKKRRSKKGTEAGWMSALSFRASKSIEGRRHTPTDLQVKSVHRQLLQAEHGERDSLIAQWAEETGGRRTEILQVRVQDLPRGDELARLFDEEEDAAITIAHRKRRSKVPLKVTPFLISATWDWINGERKAIVASMRGTIGYREPAHLFISSSTGKVLHPDSVTSIVGAAFEAAGVMKASLHRLRAKAIVENVECLVDGYLELGISVEPDSKWADTILAMAAETAGHASPSSLRPYLNFVLNRKLQTTEAYRNMRLTEKTRDLERRAEAAKAELSKIDEIRTAIRLARSGKPEAADALLHEFVSKTALSGSKIDDCK